MIELKRGYKKWEERKSNLLKGMFPETYKMANKIAIEFLKNIWIL